MNFGCRSGRALLAAAALSVALASAAAEESEPGPRRETIQRFVTLRTGGRIRLINPFGSVNARFGGYENRVELVGSSQRIDRELPDLELRMETVEAGLDITVVPRGVELPYSGPARRDRIDLALFVPRGASLDIETIDDPIQVKKVQSDVTVKSRGGNIDLQSTAGRVHARSVHGKITAILSTGATDLPQELLTETGDIEARLWEDARMRVDLFTSGEISTDFSLHVEHRDSEEPGKLAEAIVGEGGPRLTLHSKRGRIRLLRLPKDFSPD